MKNKKIINTSSGITIADNISLKFPKRKALPDSVMLIFIAFLGCTGIVNAFSTMFQIDVSTSLINIYTITSLILFSVIFVLPKKFMFSLVPILLIYQVLIYTKWKTYERGFQLICNQVHNVLFPKRSDYFRIDTDKIDVNADTELFMAFTIFLLVGIICYFTIVRPSFQFGFLFTFPFIEIGLYHGKSPSLITAFMLLVYWAALLSASQSGHCQHYGRSKTGFVRYANDFIAKPVIKFSTAGHSGIIMLSGAVIIITITMLIINISGYSRPEKLNQVKNNVRIAVSEFDFDDIGGSLQKLSASFGIGNFVGNNHKLGNVSSVSIRGIKQMTVIAECEDIPTDHIYLKGYVGSVYDGKSWSEHPKSLYDDFSWNKETAPQNILYNIYGKELEMYKELYPTSFSLNIQPTIFNTKYHYTPYNSYPQGKYDCINDTILKLKNKMDYTFDVSYYQDFDPILQNPDTYNLFSDYNRYDEFVYENYLGVPNNAETEKLYNLFIDDIPETDTLSKLKFIKYILEDNANYTLKPGKTPSDKDFVSYFLTENHKGYCVHFATSGVILARMAGIPARYVEGYVVLNKDFNEKNKTENGYEIEITDERAHAWAEIYIEGCGWIPFEFTPPSYISNLMEQINSKNTETTSTFTTALTNTTTLKKTLITPASHYAQKNTNGKTNAFSIKLSSHAKALLFSLMCTLFVIITIAVIHLIVKRKRIRSFCTHNNSQNAVNAYNYIIELLKFCNITNQNMQYLEFAEFVECKHSRLFKNNEFIMDTQIMLEALMSNKELSQEKAETIINSADKFAANIFKKKNVFGRFYMKFIRNLC